MEFIHRRRDQVQQANIKIVNTKCIFNSNNYDKLLCQKNKPLHSGLGKLHVFFILTADP